MARKRRWKLRRTTKRGNSRTSIVGAKALRSGTGRMALARYRRFWGLKTPASIKTLPGHPNIVLVGLGKSPAVHIADGTRRRFSKSRRIRHKGTLVANSSGKRMWIIKSPKGLPSQPKLKMLGYVPITEYIPFAGVERAGSPKKGSHWIHRHEEGGGSWPKIFQDQFGNYHYGPGTYSVSDWIRR